MTTKLFAGAIITTVLLAGSLIASARDRGKNNISMERAQEIALRRAAGTVEESNLVKRHGRERYSIFIEEPNGVTTHEFISARNGKILWMRDETPAAAKIR